MLPYLYIAYYFLLPTLGVCLPRRQTGGGELSAKNKILFRHQGNSALSHPKTFLPAGRQVCFFFLVIKKEEVKN